MQYDLGFYDPETGRVTSALGAKVSLLPSGRRRQALESAFAQLLAENLEERVLDFDRSAAEAAAGLAAGRQRDGRPVDMRDTPAGSEELLPWNVVLQLPSLRLAE